MAEQRENRFRGYDFWATPQMIEAPDEQAGG